MNFRHSDKDFTRDKTLSFPVTLLIISNFIRKSLSLEIVDFVNVFNKVSITKLKNFTKSAFVQRRNKIKPEVFKCLSSVLIKEFLVHDKNYNRLILSKKSAGIFV